MEKIHVFFTLFVKGRNQRANKESRGSRRIMFNFVQAARGNVGKVNQADRFTPTHTPHTRPGGPRAPGEEKKKIKMEKQVDSDRLLTKELSTGSFRGELNIGGGGKKEKTF